MEGMCLELNARGKSMGSRFGNKAPVFRTQVLMLVPLRHQRDEMVLDFTGRTSR